MVSAMRKPNRRSTNGMIIFIPSAPTTFATVIMPASNAVMLKPSCKVSGSRNGMAPMPPR